MLRIPAIALLLLASAPAVAQNDMGATPGFSSDFQETTFTIVDGNSRRPIEGAHVTFQCSSGGGDAYSGPDGAVGVTLFGEKACDLDVQRANYRELKRNWKASEPRILELLPADAAHPGWVDPSASAAGTDESPTADSAPSEELTSAPAISLASVLEALATALLPALAFLLLREISVRVTSALMMRRGGGGAAPAAETETTAAPAQSAAPSPMKSIDIGSVNGLLLQGPSQARLERALHTHRDKYRLVTWSFIPQIFGLLIAIYFTGSMDSALGLIPPGAQVLLDAVFLLFLWSLYLQGKRLVEIAAVVAVLVALSYLVIGSFALVPAGLGILPALLQALFLVAGFWRLRRAARADGRKMLVVLRVFNADRNAAFLFGPLMAMWRFVGPYLTVSDPSYVRYQFTIFQRSNLTKTLGATVTIALAVLLAHHLPFLLGKIGVPLPPWLDGEEHRDLLIALVYAAVALAAILPAIVYAWRRFLKRPEQAIARVDRIAGRGLGAESDYRGSALFCFDDVWKPAVGHMLESADAVLMDLRGFSAERQGCAYEIGELIDHYPVERLLFLVDASTPRDLLDTLIRARWAAMAADSPNRGASPGLIRYYETGDRDRRDIRNILGLLSMSLEGPTRVRPGGVATN